MFKLQVIFSAWQNKIINIHPSYLPKNKGLNPQKQVIDEKASFTGCTVHFVDSGCDTGPIILQKVNKIEEEDTFESFRERGLGIEHDALPEAIKLYCEKRLRITGRKVKILP